MSIVHAVCCSFFNKQIKVSGMSKTMLSNSFLVSDPVVAICIIVFTSVGSKTVTGVVEL
jgi:hypothetical protein